MMRGKQCRGEIGKRERKALEVVAGSNAATASPWRLEELGERGMVAVGAKPSLRFIMANRAF